MAKDVHDLFLDEIKDVFSAEKQIVEALPEMIAAAKSAELKEAFRAHLKETKEQIQRIKRIFKLLGHKEAEKFCHGAKGLIFECKEVIKEFEKSSLRDAAIIAKARRFEHYEISAYGTLRTFAKELDLKEVAQLLQESLKEELNADKTLTSLAEGGLFRSGINQEAIALAEKSVKKGEQKKSPKTTEASRPKQSAESKKAPSISIKGKAATRARSAPARSLIENKRTTAAKRSANKRPVARTLVKPEPAKKVAAHTREKPAQLRR